MPTVALPNLTGYLAKVGGAGLPMRRASRGRRNPIRAPCALRRWAGVFAEHEQTKPPQVARAQHDKETLHIVQTCRGVLLDARP
jgi:hypothetical protein